MDQSTCTTLLPICYISLVRVAAFVPFLGPEIQVVIKSFYQVIMHKFFVVDVVVVSVVHVLIEVELAFMFEKSIQQFTYFHGSACVLIWDVTLYGCF